MRRLNEVFLVVGVVALVALVVRLGPAELGAQVLRMGWGLALACLAHFAGLALDAVSLRCCAGAEGARVPYLPFLRAALAGHAINQVTPLGQLGEVTKYTLLSSHLPPARATAALVLQNLLMFVSAATLLAVAPVVAIVAFDLEGPLVAVLVVSSAVFATMTAATLFVMRRGAREGPFRLLAWLGVRPARVAAARAWWHRVEDLSREGTSHGGRWLAAWATMFLSRFANVAENAIILGALGHDAGLDVAFVALANGQLVTWLTSFVPFQVGTAEGGAYLLFAAIGLPPAAGVAMELVRKVRRIVFVGLGATVLGWQAFRRLAHAVPAAEVAPGAAPLPAAAWNTRSGVAEDATGPAVATPAVAVAERAAAMAPAATDSDGAPP